MRRSPRPASANSQLARRSANRESRATAEACEPGKHPSRTARLHAAIYRLIPEVGAIINAQPANAGAFCVTNAVFSTEVEVDREYARDGVVFATRPEDNVLELRLGQEIGEAALRTPDTAPSDRGLAWVRFSPAQWDEHAFDRLEVLEATAEALVLSRPLGPLVPMSPSAIEEMRRVFG